MLLLALIAATSSLDLQETARSLLQDMEAAEAEFKAAHDVGDSRKSRTFRVRIKKASGEGLGVRAVDDTDGTLFQISPDSPLWKHNAAHPEKAVVVGDMITSMSPGVIGEDAQAAVKAKYAELVVKRRDLDDLFELVRAKDPRAEPLMTRRWWDAALADEALAKGMKLQSAGEFDRAAEKFRAARHPERFHQLARLELARGRRAKATAAVDQALAAEPRHWPALALRGQLALAAGDSAGAAAAFARVRELFPDLNIKDLEKPASAEL